jgi:hypothetical protein
MTQDKDVQKVKCQICKVNDAVICIDCHGNTSKGRKREFKYRMIKERKVCEMCGESDKSCLSLHHERDKETHYYDEDSVKVLCLNCHFGKIHKQGMED